MKGDFILARYKVEIANVNTANIKVLTNDEMISLFRKYQAGDAFAKDDLINGNLKLVLSILKKYNKNSTAIMHCFSGSLEFARECIKEGIYIALGGVVTFKNAKKTKEVAKNIPLQYLLLETDDPYLAPVPFRGKENQPMYVKYVAEEIANLRGITPEKVAKTSTENAKKIFKDIEF